MSRHFCLISVLMLVALSAACAPDGALSDSSSSQELQRAQVVRVVDGDTIVVRLDRREERVRYIGIDAPESVHPDEPVECFGPEASEANADLLAGRAVWLEADEENRDRFGRLLRYVYIEVDDERSLVNLVLVERGFAGAESYPPNDRFQQLLFEAEASAQASGAGLWSSCR